MTSEWISAEFDEVAMVLLSSIVTYVAILVFTRIVGLRSFSKMQACDFAMTVAVGSLLASTISSADPSLLLGVLAIGCLYLGQWSLAFLRSRIGWARSRVFPLLSDELPNLSRTASLTASSFRCFACSWLSGSASNRVCWTS